MRRIFAAAVAILALLALPAAAEEANFTYGYDVASTTATYCVLEGRGGDPFDTTGFKVTSDDYNIQIAAGTVTDAGTDGAFAAVEVGDAFILRPGDGDTSNTPVVPEVETYVTAKASANSITVGDSTSAGHYRAYYYKTLTCGTAATNGWIKVSDFDTIQMTVQYEAGDLGSLDVAFFCKEGALGASAIRVYPGPSSDCGDGTLSTDVCQFSTVGQGLSVKIPHNAFWECRVSLAYSTSDGGTDEAVTTTLVGR